MLPQAHYAYEVRVSVVVRAKNEARHLPKLIAGIEAQDTSIHECVLVDSGSTDSTREIAAAAGWKVVNIAPDDFTFGRSLNYGCDAASGDILVILSAHVYPVRVDHVRKMAEAVESSSDCVVYGRQVGNSTTQFSEHVIMSHWFPADRISDQGHAFTNNANAALSKDLWSRFRYDEALTGLEDIELTARVLASGGKVSYVHEAPVVHVHEETFFSIRTRYLREARAYKQIFPGEGMTLFRAMSLFFKNIGRDGGFAIREKVLAREAWSILRFRLAQFSGAWSGFRVPGERESDLQVRMYHPHETFSRGTTAPPELLVDYGDDSG